ncbi:SRPBCC family protein [Chitinolyticbacter meiyuanensis]|uniref:SRPBCC family protein n=1 Tax=Chitinolyticbacter meiyuanensis TaxID=682798 RepID=UPI0011E5B6C8|nr:SRPBCC family protein [Chitinolyticbacter meiyuanensis]
MRYEHIIQINDLNDTVAVPMTLEALWQGLLHRARQPQDFLEHIEGVTVHNEGDGYFEREVDFGTLRVVDHVTLIPRKRIHFATQASEHHGASSLTVTIEEPESGSLFVRFAYDTALPEQAMSDREDGYYAEYVKSAYREADIDAIRRIRELFQQGQLH